MSYQLNKYRGLNIGKIRVQENVLNSKKNMKERKNIELDETLKEPLSMETIWERERKKN